jgi:hypothetical protein
MEGVIINSKLRPKGCKIKSVRPPNLCNLLLEDQEMDFLSHPETKSPQKHGPDQSEEDIHGSGVKNQIQRADSEEEEAQQPSENGNEN